MKYRIIIFIILAILFWVIFYYLKVKEHETGDIINKKVGTVLIENIKIH